MTDSKGESNPLHISWHDSAWIPSLNQNNVLEYFSDRTNPFYDRTCNNEIVKMQRLNPEQLKNMNGIEYILLHVQEPILYVIRKQMRHSISQITPISDYYVLAGVVYMAPDLNNLINSRIQTTLYHLQSGFEEAHSYSRYHPSKGYWWEFKDNEKESKEKSEKIPKEKTKEESTLFQRKRVDILLNELAKKFPPKIPQPQHQTDKQLPVSAPNSTVSESEPIKTEIKTEKTDSIGTVQNSVAPNVTRPFGSGGGGSGGPPEKKPRINI